MKAFYTTILFLMAGLTLLAQQHRYPTRIDSVQYVDQATLESGDVNPIYFSKGDTITVVGIVTFNPQYYGMSTNRKATWLQDTSLKQWGGINVFIDPNPAGVTFNYSGSLADLNNDVKFYENFIPGYKVKCTGILNEYQGNTQLNLIPVESEIVDIPLSIDTTQPVKPVLLPISTFSKNDGSGGQKPQLVTGQPYEGMYVRFENVTVVDVSGHPSDPFNRKLWSVQDEFGNKIEIRDNSGYFRNDTRADAPWVNNYTFNFPSIGTRLEYIQGVIGYSTNYGFQLSPLLPTDMKIAASAPYISKVSRYPVVPQSSDKVKIQASITDNDGKIVDASLFYSVGEGNTQFQEIKMNDLGGGIYAAYIPPTPNGSIVNYYLWAIDDSSYEAYYPDSLATGSFYKVIDGGITHIAQLQETNSDASIWADDTITNMNIQGVVTATLDHFNLAVIQDDTMPWSGIYLDGSNGGEGIASLKLGDKVQITSALVRESYGITLLSYAGGKNMKVLSHNNPLPEPVKFLNPDSINARVFNQAEAYEGMLIEFNDVFLTSNNPDDPNNYGEWAIGYDTNNYGLRCDDLSKVIMQGANTDSFSLGQKFDFVRGILYYSFGNYKLIPRDWNDISGFKTLWIPHADFSSDITSGDAPLTVNFTDQSYNTPYYPDYMWTFEGGNPSTSSEQNPQVVYENPGTFSVSLKVSNQDGADSLTKSAYILVTGIDEFNKPELILIYPNPVEDYLYLKNNSPTGNFVISVVDVTGKVLHKQWMNKKDNVLDLHKLEKGVYWLQLDFENGFRTVKPLIKQ